MLEIKLVDIIFIALNFLALFLFLRWKLFRPVSEFLEKRRQTVAADIDNARENREQSEALLAEHRALLDKGREEAREIIEEAMRQGELRRQEILASAGQEAEVLMERANLEIERQRDKAVEDLQREVATLSVLIAEKILARQVNADDQQGYFRQALTELDQSYAKYSS